MRFPFNDDDGGGYDSSDAPVSSMEIFECTTSNELNLLSATSVGRGVAIDLPLTGPSGVEDRSGGANGKYTVVMTFDQEIASVGSASSTCGSVRSVSIDGTDAHNVTIVLTGVPNGCNGTTAMITANDITGVQGGSISSASVGLG